MAAWLTERLGLDPERVTLHEGAELRGSLGLGGPDDVTLSFEGGEVWPAGSGQVDPPAGWALARLSDPRPAQATVAHGGLGTAQLLSTALTRSGRDARYGAALAVAGRLGG